MQAHSERKHAIYAASGAERWVNCPGSVLLSSGRPDKETVWSAEGTRAHEVLESILRNVQKTPGHTVAMPNVPREMIEHALNTARFIVDLHRKLPGSDLLVENKTYLDFIHPDMWGTYDGAVVDLFGTLHVFDFKYGAGHPVSPKENLQMIFYGVGLAQTYDWNFKRARLWIIQPRIRGYQGPVYWDIPIEELRSYVAVFREAIRRIENEPKTYKEGPYCFFCKAKAVCPERSAKKLAEGKAIFSKVRK